MRELMAEHHQYLPPVLGQNTQDGHMSADSLEEPGSHHLGELLAGLAGSLLPAFAALHEIGLRLERSHAEIGSSSPPVATGLYSHFRTCRFRSTVPTTKVGAGSQQAPMTSSLLVLAWRGVRDV